MPQPQSRVGPCVWSRGRVLVAAVVLAHACALGDDDGILTAHVVPHSHCDPGWYAGAAWGNEMWCDVLALHVM